MIGVICCFVWFGWVAQASLSDVETLISKHGAREALHRLHSDDHQWKAFLSHVAAGETKALAAAAQLRTVSDASASGELDFAAGEALKHNPVAVLPLIPPLALSGVCGAPDIDDPRFDSAERAVRELELRRKSLRKAKKESVEKTREACLRTLADAIPKVKAFYGKSRF
jgi:hypothetical protein